MQETHFSFPAKPSPVLTHSSQSEPNCSARAMSPAGGAVSSRSRMRFSPQRRTPQLRPSSGRASSISPRRNISASSAAVEKCAWEAAERCRAITSGSGAGTLTSTSRRTPQHESAPHSSSRQAASSRRTPS